MAPRQVPEEALAREAAELGRRLPQPLHRLEPRQLLVARVDRLDLEGLLVARVVEVALLVELGDEAVGLVAERIQLAGCRKLGGHRRLGYGVVHELTIKTERRTQLLDITSQVRDAVAGAAGAAVLVYVPHTTAGLTINEHADPAVARDFEAALERLVAEDWGWQHIEEGEENAPSHIRAALMGPQVVIPLRDGEPALGTLAGHLLLRARRAAHARPSTSASFSSAPLPSTRGCARSARPGARAHDRLARLRRERRRAPRRLRRLRPRRPAGRHGARARDEGAAPARRGDRHRRPRRRGPSGSSRRAPTSRRAAAAASRISPTRRSSRRSSSGSATRCSGSPASPTRRSSRSSPPSSSSATATSSSTRSRRPRTARRSASTAPGGGTRCSRSTAAG